MNPQEATPILERALAPSQLFLYPLGLWPGEDRKKWWSRCAATIGISIMFYFITFSQTLLFPEIAKDFNSVVEVLTTNDLPISVVVFKTICFWNNADVLFQLLTWMSEDWRNAKTSRELKTMTYYATLGRWLSIGTLGTSLGTSAFQVPSTVAFTAHEIGRLRLEANGTEFYKPMFVRAKHFFDVQKSPVYEVYWSFQALSTILGGAYFAAIDALFAVMVLHLCGQLSNLQGLLIDLPEKKTDGGQTFSKSLAVLVRRHAHLAEFSNLMEDSFNMAFLVQVVASAIVICLQAFQCVILLTQETIPAGEIGFRVYFVTCFISSLFIYCFIADSLQDKSVQVADAVYESLWYKLPPHEAKQLIFVMVRARTSFDLSAGKFVVFSLDLFARIMKSCGGYVSVLLAMRARIAE